MTNFRKVFMLLAVILLIGTASAAIAQLGDGLDANLADFLQGQSSVKIIDPTTGEELPTEGGKYVFQKDQAYEIYLEFRESTHLQFADEQLGEQYAMTMQLPEGLIIYDEVTGDIPVTIKDGDNTLEPTVKFRVTTEGLLKIWFEENPQDPDAYEEMKKLSDFRLHVNFGAMIDKDAEVLEFRDDIKKYVIDDSKIPGQAFADKEDGVFDPATKTMNYRVKINADRDCTNVVVTDTLSGDALTLNQSSLQITDAQGNPISTSRYTLTTSTNDFQYTISSMDGGEELYITYSAAVNLGADSDSDGVIEGSQASNKVIVKPEDGDPHQDETHNTIRYKTTDKSDGTDTDTTDSSGKKIVEWKIVYNDPPVVSGGGDIITDTIDPSSAAYMKYDGAEATLWIKDSDGNTVRQENIQPTYNEEKTSWSYQLPATEELYSYEITYHTVVDMDAINQHGTIQNLVNEADSDKTRPDPGAIRIPPSDKTDITKKAVEYDTDEVLWVSDIAVSAGPKDTFVIMDTLPFVWINDGIDNVRYDDTFKSLEIIGLTSPEHYSYTINGNLIEITFYKDADNLGIDGGPDGRMIQVRMTTSVNQDWLEKSLTLDDYAKTHTNYIRIKDTEAEASDSVILAKPRIKKTGKINNEMEDNHTYFIYDILLTDVTSKPVVVTDTFDKSIFSVPDQLALWYPQMKIYGGTIVDYQGTGETTVSYSDNPNGITITANDLPMQSDGKFYPYYRIHYYLRLRDNVDLAQYVRTHQGVVKNTARWGDIEDTFEYTSEYEALDKTAEKLHPEDKTDRKYKYVIEYNPDKIQLNEGADIEITDLMSPNLSLDYTSVRFETDPEGEVAYTVGGADPAVDGQEYDGGTKLVFTVPDETYVKITYEANVFGKSGEDLTFTNTVFTTRYRKVETHTEKFERDQGSGGSGTIANLKIQKNDKLNAANKMPPVTFKIYPDPEEGDLGIPMDQTDPENPKNYVIKTTDENGAFELHGNVYYIAFGVKYFIEEIPPFPEGYIPLDKPYNFTLIDEDDPDFDPETIYYAPPNYNYRPGDSFQIVNKPYESLKVKKLINSSDPADLQQTFNFRVSVLKDEAVDRDVNGEYGEVTFTRGVAEFTLTHNEVKNIRRFPPGTKFILQELDANGITLSGNVITVDGKTYAVSVSDGSVTTEGSSYTGLTGSTTAPEIVFTNSLTSIVDAPVQAVKEVSGAEWPDGAKATFTLTPENGGPLPVNDACTVGSCVKLLEAAGDVSFGTISFNQTHVRPTPYQYTITETYEGFGSGWSHDPSTIYVQISVTRDDSGTLTAEVKYSDSSDFSQASTSPITITNKYETSGQAEIKSAKSVSGAEWPVGAKATFTLMPEDSGPLPVNDSCTSTSCVKQLEAAGNVSFGTISFDQTHLSNSPYRYKITETSTGFDSGWSPDPSTIYVRVSVTQDGSNHLITHVEYSDSTDFSQASTSPITITNKFTASGTAEIKSKKDIFGAEWPNGAKAKFTLTPLNGGPLPVNDSCTSTSCFKVLNTIGEVSFGTINFDQTHLSNSPYRYMISETSEDFGSGWSPDPSKIYVQVSVTQNGSNELITQVLYSDKPDDFSQASTSPITITNTFKASGQAEIKSAKAISGAEWPNGAKATFTLMPEDSGPLPVNDFCTSTSCVKQLEAAGNVSFGTISFNQTHLSNSPYRYKITEASTGFDSGWSPDPSTIYVQVSVTQNGSNQLITQVLYSDKPDDFSQASTSPITITNTFKASGQAEIKSAKAISGAEWPNGAKAKFTLTSLNGGPLPVDNSCTSTSCFKVLDAIGEVSFGDINFDQTHLSNSPYQYTITETTEGFGSGWSPAPSTIYVQVSVTQDGSDKLITQVLYSDKPDDFSQASISPITITNIYSAKGSGEIKVKKNLEGREWKSDDSFTFTLEKVGDAPMPETTELTITKDSPEYTASFGEIPFTKAGEYRYTVKETKGTLDGIIYDENEHPVTIKVKDDGEGHLIAEDGTLLIQTVKITNVYHKDAEIELEVRKSFTGSWKQGLTFTFTLSSPDGAPMPEAAEITVTTGERIKSFGTIPFTADDMKDESGSPVKERTFTYEITEAVPEEADENGIYEGIRYDRSVQTVRITARMDEYGNIIVLGPDDGIYSVTFTNSNEEKITPTPMRFYRLPKTGFSAGRPTVLSEQPRSLNYKQLAWTLEIPSLALITDIVEVPFAGGEYPVTWLGSSAGLLEGFGLPGKGSSVLTGHNHLNTMEAGPFVLLKEMGIGDRIFVLDPENEMQIFAVYANEKIAETDVRGLERIAGRFNNSLTLITCEDERAEGGYANRRIIAAKPVDR